MVTSCTCRQQSRESRMDRIDENVEHFISFDEHESDGGGGGANLMITFSAGNLSSLRRLPTVSNICQCFKLKPI